MADTQTLGEAQVNIRADMSKLPGDLNKAKGSVTSILGSAGKLAGKAVVAGVAALGAAVVGVGAMAFASGMQMDEAYDTIIVKTGATGQALEGLKGDFAAVFKSVPTDAATASEALSLLYDRTGLTGQGLQDMTKQLLEMSRLTKGDATTNGELFTRMLGDWGIKTEDASSAMDMLFVAGQKSGVGVDSLMQSVVQFGAPLRLMGFSIKQSVAMFAKWEKEGVNSELVMGSLRIAAGKFAKEGKPLQESLMDTFAAIQNNVSATDALALGMAVFGARAGPDMVAAIREGRFSIEEFTAALDTADGAILETAKNTMDFPEKLAMVKNQLAVALAPAGLTLMDAITTSLGNLQPVLDKLGPFIDTVVAPAMERLAGAIVKVSEGDVEGALGGLFGDPDTLTEGIATTVGDIGGVLGGMVVDGIRGVFGLPSSVDDTASDLETMLRKSANQVGKALPGIAGAIGRGLIESITGGTPKAAEVAEIVIPTTPQPFGQGAALASSTIMGNIFKGLGLNQLADAEVNKTIDYIENLYKDANEQAQKGFVAQIASTINTANPWDIAGSLNSIVNPKLKQAVMQYMLQYSSEEVLPQVVEAIRTGVTGQLPPLFDTFGTTDGASYGGAFSDAVLAQARADGVLGPLLEGTKGNTASIAASLGMSAATSWQGGFNAQFGGWQPPQLNIDINGNINRPQAVPTPTTMAQTYINVGNINISTPDPKTSGRSVIDELIRRGGYQE